MNEEHKNLEAPAKRRLPWWVWLLIGLGISVPGCGVLTALAIYGVRGYVEEARVVEGKQLLGVLATGIAHCGSLPGANGTPPRLPPSSNPVPRDPARGMKYQSVATDWSSEEAFRCAGFSLQQPQYFAYQWETKSPTAGVVVAWADLDGDGNVDHRFEQAVDCASASGCSVGQLVER